MTVWPAGANEPLSGKPETFQWVGDQPADWTPEGVAALLKLCDEREKHVRDHVPHLPPGAATVSVHQIRQVLRRWKA